MDTDKFTMKSVDAIKEAEKAAYEYNNQELVSEQIRE